MSYKKITVTAIADIALNELTGLESAAPEAQFTWLTASGGGTVVEVVCTGSTFDKLKPYLRNLSQSRVKISGSSRTMPVMSYVVDDVPGGRPVLHQSEGDVSVGAGAALTLRGQGLIPGTQARLELRRQTLTNTIGPAGITRQYNAPETTFRVTAVQYGPAGNLIEFAIMPESGAGSVTTEEYADGVVKITVVPAANASNSTAIAAQIAGDALASVWITSTAVIANAPIKPFRGKLEGPNAGSNNPVAMNLKGGDGSGVAFADLLVAGVNPTNRLRIQAQRVGNQGNLINIQLRGGQVGDTVVVTGNSIVVNRIAAATAIGTLATAINANAAANALVQATAVGAGNLGNVGPVYLACGAGEQAVATVGGAPATITLHTSTSMVVTASPAALVAAGVAVGEVAITNVRLDYKVLNSQQLAIA